MENKNVIVFILSFIILATVGIIFVSQKGAQPAPAVSVPNPTPQASNIPADWKTYRNERMGFALRYPGDWIINDHLSELDIETGTIVYFQMPKTSRGGYEEYIHISFWADFNNESARIGLATEGREYKNLDDYFMDKNIYIQKVGEISINNQKAYEILMHGEGQNYGIMLEHNGIYQLSFPSAYDKSQLSLSEKQVINSFRFLK